MSLPQNIKDEVAALSESAKLQEDMRTVAKEKYISLLKDGKVDVDAYIDFVIQFNEFINHQPKPFRKISDRDMIL
jgi:hypothetical protein